jgi:acylphosphatase
MTSAALHLVIRGHVQGVGFRWWTVRQAKALGLRGWVRNRRDGSVELMAIGDVVACERLAEACARGPGAAQVSAVERSPGQDDGSLEFSERESI